MQAAAWREHPAIEGVELDGAGEEAASEVLVAKVRLPRTVKRS